MPFKPHPRPVLIQPDDPSIKLVPLTQGYVAKVSSIDYVDVSSYNWTPFICNKGKKIVYAERRGKDRKRVFMHKQIFPQWEEIDHIDGDGLNNVRDNLRDCLHAQNMSNRGENINNTSGYKGVFFHIRDKYWFSSIGIKGKHIWLGRCSSAIDAARRYDIAALEAFGNFAATNFPITDYSDNCFVNEIKKNCKAVNNKSGYKGVSFNKKSNKWSCEASVNRKHFYIGMFSPTEEGKIAAAHAYDKWTILNRDTTAYTNFPRSDYD